MASEKEFFFYCDRCKNAHAVTFNPNKPSSEFWGAASISIRGKNVFLCSACQQEYYAILGNHAMLETKRIMAWMKNEVLQEALQDE